METHIRSILKAITWRAGGTVVTFAVALFMVGKFELAAKIGILDTLIKIFAFYIHERVWNQLKIGREKPPEYQI